jgi:hypothetical protein
MPTFVPIYKLGQDGLVRTGANHGSQILPNLWMKEQTFSDLPRTNADNCEHDSLADSVSATSFRDWRRSASQFGRGRFL